MKLGPYLTPYLKVLVAQSCLTLGNPTDCSPPGSSVHGILQARILEWVAMPFSKYLKVTSKWIKNLYLRAKSILLKENLHDLGFGNDKFDMLQVAQATKKLNFIKNFCTSNDTEMKRQPMGWEKMFANHISDK